MGKTAFIFPGQGAQAVGMGQDVYEKSDAARAFFDAASEAVGLDLKALCFEENENINITEFTQVCLLATSVALLREIESGRRFTTDEKTTESEEIDLAAKRIIRAKWQEYHRAHPTAETEIVGWSLGSGQAMLCCQDLNYNFGLRAHVFTFGSVRPFRARGGEAERLKKYLDSLYVECRNFANANDIVTYMPPFRGFSMMKREDLGAEKRTLFRLLNPMRFHTIYDDPALYAGKE